MKTTINIDYKGYLITKEGLQELFKKINDEISDIDNSYIEFTLQDDNNVQYDSNNIDFLFESLGLLDTKRIIYADVTFATYGDLNQKRIGLTLKHGEYGYIESKVSGYDQIWVNGIHRSIENIITNFERQNQIQFKYKWYIGLGIILFTYIPTIIIIRIVLISQILDEQSLNLSYYIISIGLLFLFMALLLQLILKIGEIYPPIEFVIGPDHKKFEQKRKKFIRNIIILILIPIIISIISYFITKTI